MSIVKHLSVLSTIQIACKILAALGGSLLVVWLVMNIFNQFTEGRELLFKVITAGFLAYPVFGLVSLAALFAMALSESFFNLLRRALGRKSWEDEEIETLMASNVAMDNLKSLQTKEQNAKLWEMMTTQQANLKKLNRRFLILVWVGAIYLLFRALS